MAMSLKIDYKRTVLMTTDVLTHRNENQENIYDRFIS